MDPNNIEELVTLDHILKETGYTVEALKHAGPPAQYACEYIYSPMTDRAGFGRAFQEAAEKLMPASGGKIQSCSSLPGGFYAVFPSAEKRLEFLKAFSRAAAALRTAPEPDAIVRTEEGFILGAVNRGRRGMFG